ncbi:MAG: hypothetical protein IJC79_00555 [Clostridia bacterium]|nr:hypothetical protein [Clostridia bacterium]
MNKKLKLLTALVLIVQLIVPAGFLYSHYTAIDYALKYSPEYKFKLLDIDFYGYDFMKDVSDITDEPISIEVGGARNYYNEKIAVTVGEDGFADLTGLGSQLQTRCWFDYSYYRKNSTFNRNEYSFEDGVDIKALVTEINKTHGWASNFHENGCYAYVTAKVYKGVFIPTAIYVRGEKVITLNKDTLN